MQSMRWDKISLYQSLCEVYQIDVEYEFPPRFFIE